MRNQKLRDASLLLPVVGVFLMLPAVLRLVSGKRFIADLPSLPTFLFLVWIGLIVGAALLSRKLLNAEVPLDAGGAEARHADDETEE